MFSKEEIEKLENIIRELHRIVRDKDFSVAETNIRDAITYLNCGKMNAEIMGDDEKYFYSVRPQIYASHNQ